MNKTFNLVLKSLLVNDVPKISVDEAAKQKLKYIFFDTREQEEYKVSRIEGALFSGYLKFDDTILSGIAKQQPIITYCTVGKRSEDVARKMVRLGYANVFNLYGGLFEWFNEGYDVYDSENKRTLNIHVYNKLWGALLKRGNKFY